MYSCFLSRAPMKHTCIFLHGPVVTVLKSSSEYQSETLFLPRENVCFIHRDPNDFLTKNTDVKLQIHETLKSDVAHGNWISALMMQLNFDELFM